MRRIMAGVSNRRADTSLSAYTTQDLKIKFNFADPQFTAFNQEYQLSTLSEDTRKDIEEALGITLPAIGDSSPCIQLDNLIARLQTNTGEATANTIELDAQANGRWSHEDAEANRSYTLNCNKPEFAVSAYPGNIWTKEFTMNTLMEEQVVSGDFAKLSSDMTYQFSTNNKDWSNLGEDLRKADLTPGTTYYIRGLYRGVIASEAVEVKTYPIIELENGDMEDWSYTDGPQASWPDKGPFWKRWYINNNRNDNQEGWCSLNGLTTSNNDPKAYISNSGTERTTDCHSGEYAAEIKTIGWGSGTTAASPISSITTITSGELFLGKMDNITPIYGKTFNSKPTKLKFYYKYSPEGEHTFKVTISLKQGDIIIATNEFNGESTDTYVEKTLDFIYNSENVTENVQTLFIQFTSGDNKKSEVDKASISRGSRHVGNKLYIDDISLIYDK